MNNRWLALTMGEIKRLVRYNLLITNLVLLLSWVIVCWFLDAEQVKHLLPTVFYIDTVMMTTLLSGATVFYEKKEHTVNSIMVSPASEGEYMLAKMLGGICNSLLTVIIISVAVYIINGVTFNLLYLVPAVIAISALHAFIGVSFTYITKDFTGMLMATSAYILVMCAPPLLALFGLIDVNVSRLFIALPTGIAIDLINASVAPIETYKAVFGFIYLPAVTYAVYRFIARPFFNKRVTRETGV